MKLFICVLTAMMAFSTFASADEASNKPQKIYVEPSNVQVGEDGILVKLQDQIVLVKNLRSTDEGFLCWIQKLLLSQNQCGNAILVGCTLIHLQIITII